MRVNSSCCPASGDAAQWVGDPVDTLTGAVFDRKLEFRLVGPLEFRWLRLYDSSRCHQRFALGWGQTHDFDRTLRFDGDGLAYHAPLGRIYGFPPLMEDGEECSLLGFRLRRVHVHQYQIFPPNEPAMEFLFADMHQPARLSRLFQERHQIQFAYNTRRQLERIIDSAGRVIRVMEEPGGRLISLSLEREAGQSPQLLVSYQYDNRGNLVGTGNESGHGYKFAYDQNNRLTLRTGRKGFSFRFTYDDQGRCLTAQGDENLYAVRLEYEIPRRVTKVTRDDGGVWTYFFDDTGGLIQILDPHGGVARFVRDESGRVTTEVDANENATRVIYNAAGTPVAKILPNGQRIGLPEQPNRPDPYAEPVPTNPGEYEYGRLLRPDGILLPDLGMARSFPAPDEVRRLIMTRAESAPRPVEADKSGANVQPLGWKWWPAPNRGRIFSETGKLVGQQDDAGHVRHWQYDASGNVSSYQDFDGSVTKYDYGSWHFLLRATNPLGATVHYTYNSEGEIVSFTDAGGTRSEYTYNRTDKLVEVRRNGDVRDRYMRDAAGNLVGKQAADGRVLLKVEMGPGNRPIKRTLASGDEHSFKYDTQGRCLVAATTRDEIEWTYDRFGNRASEKRNGLGVEHEFVGVGKPIESRYFGRFVVRYERRPDGTLVITDPGGQKQRIRVHAHGLVERHFSNGSREFAQYDGHGRCLFKHAQRRSEPAWSRRYHWSGEGELRRAEDNLHGEIRHEYDAAHRLRRRVLPGGRAETFEFDVADNLLRKPGLEDVSLHSGNRLNAANGEVFTYNDRHHIATRRSSRELVSYEYDSRDMLSGAELKTGKWEAHYDPFRRRTRKIWQEAKTEFYWNGHQLIAEVGPTGRLRLYLYADALALTPLLFIDYASIDAPPESGRRYFIFSDQVGTPVLVEEESGGTAWTASMEPFGRATVSTEGRIEFHLRFPGHYFDVETGLHYNRFRYYDPRLGRYLQSDPWGITGGYNLYGYRTNPLHAVDVRGLGEENDPACKPEDDAESNQRQSIQERIDDGGNPPQYALDHPDLYEYDPSTGQYRRIPGEGHSRSSEFPSGYREETHNALAAAHTDEGRAQGGVPVDGQGNPIPHDQLTWRDANGNEIPYNDLTYDHQTSCVDMFNNGATVTDPDTGAVTTYPPGNNTDRATRNDFYNDPNNLQPMSRSDNSSKGGGGATYNDNPTGPDYEN